jgi:hypothetical protein
MAGSCEHGNEPLGYTKYLEFLGLTSMESVIIYGLLAEMPGVARVDHRRMGCTPPHNFVFNCITYAGPLLTTSSLCNYG